MWNIAGVGLGLGGRVTLQISDGHQSVPVAAVPHLSCGRGRCVVLPPAQAGPVQGRRSCTALHATQHQPLLSCLP